MIFRKNVEQVVEAAVDDELVLTHIDLGRFDVLRDTGRAVWQEINGERDLAAIVAVLAGRYVAPAEVLRRDVQAFVEDLERVGYVRRVTPADA